MLDEDNPDEAQNEVRTHESEGQLRELLMAWDPIGVSGFPQAGDEYDCLLRPLMQRLSHGASAEGVRNWLVEQVEGHFGLDADPAREGDLARNISDWWSRRRRPPAR